MARVSVLLCVFDIENKPLRGLESMLAQEFDDFEIVLVDDGSTDNTHDIIESYADKDKRVRAITAPCNLGLAGALNLAITEARADILMRMDIDDWSPPWRMARQFAYLTKHPEVGVVSCAFERVRTNGEEIDVIALPLDHVDICRRLSVASTGMCHPGAMMRKICFLKYGFYNPHFRRFQDYELWLRWRSHVVFANTPDILLKMYSADSYEWERIRKFGYWQMYRYDFLARYLNFPHSRSRPRDLFGWFLIQIHYFAYKPIRWLLLMLHKEIRRARWNIFFAGKNR